MHRFYLLTILLILLFGPIKAMAKHHEPNVRIGGLNLSPLLQGDSDPYGDFSTLTVPIKKVGNLIVVDAQVDTLSGNFVLDTGAPYLVLNETYFRYLPKYAEQEAGGINGRSPGTFTTMVHNFSLGFDLHYDRLIADVTNLSAIENSKHIKILGLLGTRVFAKLAITIDLDNSLLYIHKVDKQGEILAEQRVFNHPDVKTTFRYMNDVIYLKTGIDGKNLWLAFDTGAETNMLDYHVPKAVLKSLQVLNKTKLVGVGGASYEIIYARFDKLNVGDHDFISNRVLVSNLDAIGKAYGYSVDGILGFDFFTRGVFTINFAKKEFEMYIYNHQSNK